jgi:coenzyme F420-0:L-glutamate ligase/coenzyme F420-1:gamma-L-glutamate ligase
LTPIDDWRGRTDGFGRELQVTTIAVADAAAAAADLARGKDSREPAVVVRGLERFVTDEDGPGAAALRRPPELDLFR